MAGIRDPTGAMHFRATGPDPIGGFARKSSGRFRMRFDDGLSTVPECSHHFPSGVAHSDMALQRAHFGPLDGPSFLHLRYCPIPGHDGTGPSHNTILGSRKMIELSVVVRPPFCGDLNRELVELGAKYVGRGIWLASPERERAIRDACLRYVGTDGVCVDMVDVRIGMKPGTSHESTDRFLKVGGKSIARRSYYRLLVEDDVDVLTGAIELEHRGRGDWPLRYKAPQEEAGFLLLKCMSRFHAEGLLRDVHLGSASPIVSAEIVHVHTVVPERNTSS